MASSPQESTAKWRAFGTAVWSLVGLLVLIAVGFWLLGRVFDALIPFLLALVIVLLLRRVVDRLEAERVPRAFAVLLCYVVAVSVLVAVGIFVMPPLIQQLRAFIEAFPGYYEKAVALWLQLQGRFYGGTLPGWTKSVMDNVQNSVVGQASKWSSEIAAFLVATGSKVIALAFNLLIAAVVAFWILKDLPAMREELLLLAGPGRRQEAALVLNKVSQVLGGYLKGQLIVSAVTGTLVAIGLTILRVPYGAVIGVLTGMLNVVPYLGPFTGGVIAAIAAAFVSPITALWAIVVVVLSQQLTDNLVTPRIMSEQVDLHPVLVIFSLLAGGTLFGLPGLLLAIPVAAIAKGLFVYYFEKYTQSDLAREDGALFKAKTEATPEAETVQEEVAKTGEEAEKEAERGAKRLAGETAESERKTGGNEEDGAKEK